ncbi:urease accessory protein UreE [Neomegalonema sp.]|uniref:urease accessory protein UreE n=1 Tax=Neomegalonema sp. TaxID=2039713 RepID=UPI0026095B90|nr:urease accessory protein UreE [Neomegalonema sp.]MDD2869273.1 urease accessory protein UreE [Neomegalonema sp.]
MSLAPLIAPPPRAVAHLPAPRGPVSENLLGEALLSHEERHVRRRLLRLTDGSEILVDLPEPARLEEGDRLALEDGRRVRIRAASEMLYAVTAGSSPKAAPLIELAWHLGNRHFAAQIERTRLLIPRDPVIRAMLEGLGARVAPAVEPFRPVRGAYHGHAHG